MTSLLRTRLNGSKTVALPRFNWLPTVCLLPQATRLFDPIGCSRRRLTTCAYRFAPASHRYRVAAKSRVACGASGADPSGRHPASANRFG